MPAPLPQSIDPAFPGEPTRADYLEHRRTARAAGLAPGIELVIGPTLLLALVAGGVVLALCLVAGLAAAALGVDASWATVTGLGLGALVVVLTAVFGYRVVRDRMLDRRFRLDRISAAHGFAHREHGSVRLPGLVFAHGRERAVGENVRTTAGREIEAGNYSYVTGSRKQRTTHRWSYVAVRLDAPLPHLVLDARSNDFLGSNLPTSLAGAQRLSLEGDFDRSFRLSVPAGYEADALYLFTPDVMADFIDAAGRDDVELVDDWMLAYRQDRLDFGTPAAWARIMRLARLGDELAGRAARYRDDRVAGNLRPAQAQLAGTAESAPRIAPTGRRLRPGVPWPALVFLGAVLACGAVLWISQLVRG